MSRSTDDVSLERTGDLHEWQTVLSSSMYPLHVAGMGRQEFSGSIRARRVGDVTFSLIEAQPHRVVRPAGATKGKEDRFGLSLQLSGTSIVSQRGRTHVLEPGDYCTYDSVMPYSRVFEEPTLSFVVILPRSQLLLPESMLRDAAALVMKPEGAFNSLYADLLRGMAHSLEDFDAFTGHRAARALVELLSTSLIHNLGSRSLSRQTKSEHLRLAILDYVEEHVADSDLSATKIASRFFVSTRHLFQLFAGEERTLAQRIREARLVLAEKKLSDPSLLWMSISQISETCGYDNANYFSRVFKDRHGVAPSRYRELQATRLQLSDRPLRTAPR